MFVVNQDISPNIKNSEFSEFAFHIWKAQNQVYIIYYFCILEGRYVIQVRTPLYIVVSMFFGIIYIYCWWITEFLEQTRLDLGSRGRNPTWPPRSYVVFQTFFLSLRFWSIWCRKYSFGALRIWWDHFKSLRQTGLPVLAYRVARLRLRVLGIFTSFVHNFGSNWSRIMIFRHIFMFWKSTNQLRPCSNITNY